MVLLTALDGILVDDRSPLVVIAGKVESEKKVRIQPNIIVLEFETLLRGGPRT
jgi:hypothetical protein